MATEISERDVQSGFDTIVERQSPIYAQQFEDLGGTQAQPRILRLLARSLTASVFARGSLDPVQVANASDVTTALRALADRELVASRSGEWQAADPFPRRWLTDSAPTAEPRALDGGGVLGKTSDRRGDDRSPTITLLQSRSA